MSQVIIKIGPWLIGSQKLESCLQNPQNPIFSTEILNEWESILANPPNLSVGLELRSPTF
jgi:hypothetical protein